MAGLGFIVLAAANHFRGLPFAEKAHVGYLFWCLHDFVMIVEQILVQDEVTNHLFSLPL